MKNFIISISVIISIISLYLFHKLYIDLNRYYGYYQIRILLKIQRIIRKENMKYNFLRNDISYILLDNDIFFVIEVFNTFMNKSNNKFLYKRINKILFQSKLTEYDLYILKGLIIQSVKEKENRID